ncbi:uncharacterized protein LOC106155207 [Lingula anatina]|uniref:Uncharacterized protein LOC106155207 n=1 Tax=Lingula anatina TaxID=7574 RepID=A0A1S3HH25_LINAN|nr:uncharacterized protein LOC106155207 [Lingula anatina]XP_013385376.1 uncharacterized protein LOC106155207 [Lingula anatina]XP_013385377.1 uncharacterized protein LOC106155207 [Lingula anatina]|eukprot:XP_013385375.1 uncharacterized protein LOC106155207 [Lingula anatina]
MREHLLHPPPMTLDLRSPEGQSHQLTGVLSKVKQGLGGFLMDVSPLLQGSATLMGIPFPHRSEKDSHSLKGKSIEEILQSQAETLPAALRFYKTLVKKASEEYEKGHLPPCNLHPCSTHFANIRLKRDGSVVAVDRPAYIQVTQQERLMDVILSTSNGLFFTQLSDLLGHKVSPLWIDDLDAVSSHTLYMELKKSLLSQAEVLGHHLKEKNIPHFEEMYKFLGGRAYHYSQVLSVSNFENLLHGGDGEHWLNPLSPRAMRQAYLLLYPAMMSRGLVRRYGEPNWTKEEGKCIIKAMAKTVDGNIPMEFFIKDESVSIPALKKLSRMNVLGYKPEMGQPLGCGTIIPSSPLQLVYIKRLAETF